MSFLTLVALLVGILASFVQAEEIIFEPAIGEESALGPEAEFEIEYTDEASDSVAFSSEGDEEGYISFDDVLYEEETATEEETFDDTSSFYAPEAEAPMSTDSTPDSLDSVISVPEITPAPTSSANNLSIKMLFLNADGDDPIYVAAAPYVYVFLREKLPSTSTKAHQRYLVKLGYLTEDSNNYWYVSGELAQPKIGSYDVEYYTAKPGQENACDMATYRRPITSDPDVSIFEKIVPGGNYAGSILKLGEDARSSLLITDEGEALTFFSTANHASVTLGAFKQILGVSDTTASFGFNLYSADSTWHWIGDPVKSRASSSGRIEEGVGSFVPFDGIVIPAAGDYYFVIEEDDETVPSYFTSDKEPVYIHVKVEYNNSDKLCVTQMTTSKGDEGTRNLSVKDLGETINIEMENRDIVDQYRNVSYSIYGPIPGMMVKDDDIADANLFKKVSAQSGGKSAFSAVPVPTGSWWSYSIVERVNGVENRNHRIVIPTRRVEGESPKWYVKEYGSFTNTYKSGEKATGIVTIKKVVVGKPTTDQKFNFQMVASGASKAMWSGSLPGDDGKYEKTIKVGFPKAGTYTATLREVAGSAKGYTYDKTEHELKFVVTDDKKGSFSVKVSVDGKETKNAVVTFTNTYAVDVPIRIVTNTEPMRALASGEFRVRNSKGSKVGKMWKSDGNAHVVTVPGDGVYTIEEITPPTDYRKQTNKKYLQFTVKDGEITYNGSKASTIYVPHEVLSGKYTFKNVSAADTSKAVKGSDFYLYRITYSKGTSAYEKAAEQLSKGNIPWDDLSATAKQTSSSKGNVSFTVDPNTYYVIRQTAVSGSYQRTPDSKSAIIGTSYNAKTDTFRTSVISGNNILVKKDSSWIWKQTAASTLSITSVKAGTKKLTITWKVPTDAASYTGYKIQYSTAKDFKTGNKTITVKDNKASEAVISSLKTGTKYYVRIRAYKLVKGDNYEYYTYSNWSSVKNATVK